MTSGRVVSVLVTTAVLLVLRTDGVVGQTVEDCVVDTGATVTVPVEAPIIVPTVPPVTVPAEPPVPLPDLPLPGPCQEMLESITTTTSSPTGPDVPGAAPVTSPSPLSPPVPMGAGCRAVDPGTPKCSFVATGWIEVVVSSVGASVDVMAGDGKRVGGFAGAGYEPATRFSVVVPAAPGDLVVVRANRGWVVVRSRS